MARYIAERGFSTLRRALALVGRGPGGVLGRALGALRGARPPSPTSACSTAGRCRAPTWFPGARLNYARARAAHGPAGRAGDRLRRARTARPAELSWDELTDQVARCAAGLRRLGVERGDRVAAYLPNAPEAVVGAAGHGEHRRDLVELRAGVRRAHGDRPLRADRAQGAARHGRLHATAASDFDRADRVREIAAAIPSLEHTVMVPSGWDELLARAGRARVRAGAVRPPAVGPLLVRHHRAAQGDRAGAGRHPARAPEEDAAAHGPDARRTASSGSPPPAG